MSDDDTKPVTPETLPTPRSARTSVAAVVTADDAKPVEAWRAELETPDEEFLPTKAYHRWAVGLVVSKAEYVAAIDRAMNATFSSPKRA